MNYNKFEFDWRIYMKIFIKRIIFVVVIFLVCLLIVMFSYVEGLFIVNVSVISNYIWCGLI